MKSAVKTPARKTNNQASFSGSILKNNMEVEAAMELQRHLDETGVHQVHTRPFMLEGFLGLHHVRLGFFGFAPSSTQEKVYFE